jgi:phosphinothricin acetyltransferase
MIRPVTLADTPAITAIYNPYIERTTISFEETPLPVSDMAARIRDISASHPYLVYEEDSEILGYAYLHQWKERAAYRFAVEDSIYLKTGHERKGIGEALLRALLEEARKMALHAVVAVITIPNAASTGLHEKLGFRKIGELREIGFKFDSWLVVGYWQILL